MSTRATRVRSTSDKARIESDDDTVGSTDSTIAATTAAASRTASSAAASLLSLRATAGDGNEGEGEGEGTTVLWPVPHVQQTKTWDCGVACARMVIEAVGGPAVSESDALSVAQKLSGVAEDSLWTIDVCCVLVHYGVRHRFCTTFTGASEELASVGFYAKTFSDDSKRVNALFDQAESKGICVEKRRVSTDEMLSHIRSGGLAIVLVDGSRLTESKWYHAILPAKKPAYHGHFVVLCGVDTSRGIVRFADPSTSQPVCECSVDRFDDARDAHGTDNDIILIDVEWPTS